MRTIGNGTRVAVIGGAGFLGSHCVDHLVSDRRCDVLVIDNLCVGRREWINDNAAFEHADVTGSESMLLRLFQRHQTEYVLNFSAWPYIPVSFARPQHVCDVNFAGACKVINAAQEAGCKGILQVSSAEIYGEGQASDNVDENNHCQSRIDEGAPVIPHSSYGVSKAAVDNFVQVRWREAKTPCIALRQFNCVGPRESHPYIVPEIIGQLSGWGDYVEGYRTTAHEEPSEAVKRDYFNQTQIVHLGNNSTRDFLYAGDQAKIAVELLERGSFGEVYNLGSETGIKIYDLAKLIGKVMGFVDVKVEPDPARVRPWEIWSLLSDNSKIRETLRDPIPNLQDLGLLHNLTPLEEALRKTVNWFNENGRKWPWEK